MVSPSTAGYAKFEGVDTSPYVRSPTATTARLAAVGDSINTVGKYVGKMVFNTDTGIPVWADSAAANGTWSGADGAVDHTPV